MSVTFTLQTTITGGGMTTLGGSGEETGTVPGGIDASFAAGSVNVAQPTSFNITDLKAFLLKSDQNMTLTTNGTNEIQRITITGTPTGGSFTATFEGQTTAAIPYNATAPTVQTAIENLSNVAVGDVSVAGGPLPGTPVDVTFLANLGVSNRTQMTTSDSFTGGSSPASAVTTTTGGVAPDNTFNLKANRPFPWSLSDGYFANPFTVNVTRFNVTCATSARLQGRILT